MGAAWAPTLGRGAGHCRLTGWHRARSALQVQSSRQLGSAWLLDGLWRKLGVADALRGVLGGRRFTTAVERVLFALVANRAVDPMSKLSAAEWASCDAAIPGLAGMDDDQAYRAMHLLVAADTEARVQEAVFFTAANLLNLEVDLLFFDTTSTFFQRDGEDEGADGFRRFGHSKDHRPDLPQVVIGLAVTREGIPVRCWCWPGNTNDMTVLKQVKDDLRGWRLGRIITVVDRGFASDDNLAYLTARVGTGSPGSGCATAPPTWPRCWPSRAATRASATTCGSRRSASARTMGPAGSCSATTPSRPTSTTSSATSN
jgi:hypothetical protein